MTTGGEFLALDQVVAEWGIAQTEDEHRKCVRWLADQIRAKKVPAHRIRRRLLMNQDDRNAALEAFATMPTEVSEVVEPVEPRKGLSAASMRRRLRDAS